MRSFMGYTTPEPLIDLITDFDSSDLVKDALVDADTFHGNTLRRYSTTESIIFPLRLALPTPCEENITPAVTAIRLLHQVAPLKEFQIEAYPEDVQTGIQALTTVKGETYKEKLQRIKGIDRERPELHLAVTQAKIMILNSLDPVGLPKDCMRLPDTRIGMGTQLEKYSKAYETLLPKEHPWNPKVRKALHIGKNALLDSSLLIRTK